MPKLALLILGRRPNQADTDWTAVGLTATGLEEVPASREAGIDAVGGEYVRQVA